LYLAVLGLEIAKIIRVNTSQNHRSVMVQNKFTVQRLVMARCAVGQDLYPLKK
jgi:hypothetical protein